MAKKVKRIPVVALVGRVNVGKSTLFNRLIEENKAVVSHIAGTTRDLNYGRCSWQGRDFLLVDTGGLEKKVMELQKFTEQINEQTRKAIEEADVIVLVVDAKVGLMPEDQEIAKISRASGNPVYVVANKVDAHKDLHNMDEFYALGFEDIWPVSAANGKRTGDMLDELVKRFPKKIKATCLKFLAEDKREILNIAFIGKPNVGKSSLVNAILGQDRIIVSDIPHTTREPQDTIIKYKNEYFNLIDTAGLRKKVKVKRILERAGMKKTGEVLERADIAVLVLDISEPLAVQDERLAGELKENGSGLIIVANKWDKIENKETNTVAEYENLIYSKMPFLRWAPIIFVSASKKQRVYNILDLAEQIKANRYISVADNALNKFIKKLIKIRPPVKASGTKRPYIKDFMQIGVNPPRFKLVIGIDETIHFSYLRFVQNQLRDKFGFQGTPIKIEVVNK